MGRNKGKLTLLSKKERSGKVRLQRQNVGKAYIKSRRANIAKGRVNLAKARLHKRNRDMTASNVLLDVTEVTASERDHVPSPISQFDVTEETTSEIDLETSNDQLNVTELTQFESLTPGAFVPDTRKVSRANVLDVEVIVPGDNVPSPCSISDQLDVTEVTQFETDLVPSNNPLDNLDLKDLEQQQIIEATKASIKQFALDLEKKGEDENDEFEVKKSKRPIGNRSKRQPVIKGSSRRVSTAVVVDKDLTPGAFVPDTRKVSSANVLDVEVIPGANVPSTSSTSDRNVRDNQQNNDFQYFRSDRKTAAVKMSRLRRVSDVPGADVPGNVSDKDLVPGADVLDNVSDTQQSKNKHSNKKSRISSEKLQLIEAEPNKISKSSEIQLNARTRPLFADRSIAGAKCEFRLRSNIELHNDPKVSSNIDIPINILTRLDFLQKSMEIGKICPKCMISSVKLSIRGVGLSEHIALTCNKCNWSLKDEPPTIEIQKKPEDARTKTRTTIVNLALVYESMIKKGLQYDGYASAALALGLEPDSVVSYARHRNKVYHLMSEFFNENLCIGHNLVKEFYRKFFPERVSPCGKYIWPIISIDGSFDKRGFHARHGISIAHEIYTGISLDHNNLEKCFDCTELTDVWLSKNKKTRVKRCNILGDVCPRGLFHGQSAQMEGENAFQIFKRGPNYGFEYRTYISDGDNKVWHRLKDIYSPMYDQDKKPILDAAGNPVRLTKVECANHLSKQMYQKWWKLSSTYTPPKPANIPATTSDNTSTTDTTTNTTATVLPTTNTQTSMPTSTITTTTTTTSTTSTTATVLPTTNTQTSKDPWGSLKRPHCDDSDNISTKKDAKGALKIAELGRQNLIGSAIEVLGGICR